MNIGHSCALMNVPVFQIVGVKNSIDFMNNMKKKARVERELKLNGYGPKL